MSTNLHCLFCDSKIKPEQKVCDQCGMNLPTNHPQNKGLNLKNFLVYFTIIAIFCGFMMWYLPR